MRLTVAQALVRFLAAQEVERDGRRQRFFAGCFGIFGHGNVAGLGQALQQYPDALLRGYDLERTLRQANAAGAFVASRLACADDMPTREELDALVEEVRA